MTFDSSHPLIDTSLLSSMARADRIKALEMIDVFREQTDVWARFLSPDFSYEHWHQAVSMLATAAVSIAALRLGAVCQQTLDQAASRQGILSKTETALLLADIKEALVQTEERVAVLTLRLTVFHAFD